MQLATPWAHAAAGQAAQRQARVGIVDAGQVLILEHGDERRGRLAGGRARPARAAGRQPSAQAGSARPPPPGLCTSAYFSVCRLDPQLAMRAASSASRSTASGTALGKKRRQVRRVRKNSRMDGMDQNLPFAFLIFSWHFPGGAARRPPGAQVPCVLCAAARGPPPSQTSVFIITRRFQESTTVCVRPMPTAAAAILRQLAQPQMPSAVRPNARCAPLSAVSVRAPKMPSSPPAG